jgi:hypothetical protein
MANDNGSLMGSFLRQDIVRIDRCSSSKKSAFDARIC